MNKPKFGEDHIERVCGYCPEDSESGDREEICGKEAVIHVAWEDANPIIPGFACAEHKQVILSFHPFQHHSLGACCGMPGALWFCEENVCGYEEGLPLGEPVRSGAWHELVEVS